MKAKPCHRPFTITVGLFVSLNVASCEGDMSFFRDPDDMPKFFRMVDAEADRFFGDTDTAADLSFRRAAVNLAYMHEGAVIVDLFNESANNWRARVRRPVEPIGKQARANYLAENEPSFRYETIELNSQQCPAIAELRDALQWWQEHLADPEWRKENAPPPPYCMGCYETVYKITSKHSPEFDRNFDDSCGDEYSMWFHQAMTIIDNCIEDTGSRVLPNGSPGHRPG